MSAEICRDDQARQDHAPSQTALAAALMRAVHTRFDRPPLIDDPWADRRVSDAERAALCRRILADADPDARARLQALGSDQALLAAALRRHPTDGGGVPRSRDRQDALSA